MDFNEVLNLLSVILWGCVIVSWIAKLKTRNYTTRKKRIVYIVVSIFYWISLVLYTVVSIILGNGLFIIFIALCYFSYKYGLFESSGSNYTSSYTNDNYSQTNQYNKTGEKRYSNYKEGKVTTIEENGRVYRSDGVCGFKEGDYIYYNDNSVGHIVMLDDENGIIE